MIVWLTCQHCEEQFTSGCGYLELIITAPAGYSDHDEKIVCCSSKCMEAELKIWWGIV